MKIVVLDGFAENPGDLSWEPVSSMGDFTVYDRTSNGPRDIGLIIERAKDAEIVFTNKTPITREVLDHLPILRYIGVLATGYNIVDTAYAREKGVTVTNIPTYGTAAVAQFTIALILEMCHHIGAHSASVFAGKWQGSIDFCYWDYPLVELAGKTLGLIGFGRIGQRTARIAQALGMDILVHDIHVTPALESDTLHFVSLEDLLAGSDIISLHCPLTAENTGLINSQTISKLKEGVMIVNTSRGPLINEKDLTDALNSGKVAFAAVDVVSREPISPENPLLRAKNLIITPHIAWAPKESRQRLMDIAADNLRSFIEGRPQNVVK
jgi:glycerate dehydrogenase